jgi:predicted ATPase with chaperone activity
MKLALLAAAIGRAVGGVLVFGDPGTGKSTAIRALASLLPHAGPRGRPVRLRPGRPRRLVRRVPGRKPHRSACRVNPGGRTAPPASDEVVDSLCVAAALGITSLRAPLLAVRQAG